LAERHALAKAGVDDVDPQARPCRALLSQRRVEATMVVMTSSPVPASSSTKGIVVRRFAGHASHADHFDTPLRVVHLTDQHVGAVTPMRAQLAAVEAANAADADIVCLTGDFVCHSQAYLADLTEVVRAFRAPVFAVLGNHDWWSGANPVVRALTSAGAVVLRNQHTVVDIAGARLQVVGIDDAYTGNADVARAVRGLDPRLPSIGLSHIAEEADRLWQVGVPFVLSGHTHAGQITVARLHELSLGRVAGHRYVHGLYGSRTGDGAVYVGAGIGAAVMPIRIGDRGQREVAVFELGTEPGALHEHHVEQPALPGRAPSEALKERRRKQVEVKFDRRRRRGASE
jgi:predicted MPP superfamily phosphohydrolase